MFCRSIERGEWAWRLEKLDGEEEADVVGEEDGAECCCILDWCCS